LARSSPNSIPATSDAKDKQKQLHKNLLFLKTPSSLSDANFLTVFGKSKVCTFIALRLATGFVKNIRFAFVAFAA
jgi:hypothetical protein